MSTAQLRASKKSQTLAPPTLAHHVTNVLVCFPTFNNLAQDIMKVDGQIETTYCGGISWKKFEDGFPNLMIQNVENFRSRDVVFLADFLHLEALFSQLAVLYALPRYCVKSLTVVLPYFPAGTMERVDTEGQIATAMTLAMLLSNIPLCATGPAKLIVYDIHALQERFYFHNNIIPILVTAIPLFLDVLSSVHASQEVAIAFPDEGAMKRFGGQFKGFELILCSKVRDGDKRKVVVKEGEAKGRHVFIVDDLVKTGGTLLECKSAILKEGASHVSAFVTHAVFPQDSWKRFALSEENKDPHPFEHFYTTDSCPTVTDLIKDIAPFSVLSLAPSISHCVGAHQI
jgi:ribose-phosphate pyrophosphokinase